VLKSDVIENVSTMPNQCLQNVRCFYG